MRAERLRLRAPARDPGSDLGRALADALRRPPARRDAGRVSSGSRARPTGRTTAAEEALAAGRGLNGAAGALAASVLFDSAMEHYRGRFKNPAMWTPLAVSAVSLVASLHGSGDRRQRHHPVRDAAYLLAGATGAVGTAFHLFNVTKRTGGFSWQNLFYGAPLGAPAAISLSGLMGWLGERVRDTPPGAEPEVLGVPAGRAVAALTGASLLGTVAEAGLLHFRGAFHNPAMLTPVTLPPVAAALLFRAAAASEGERPLTRWVLRATALAGVAGVALHAYGVQRNMGGWRNWRQNLYAGPPLPAPPAFTGLAAAGLAALRLLEGVRRG